MFLNSYLCCTSCCRIAALKKVPKEGLKVKEVYRLEHVNYIFESKVPYLWTQRHQETSQTYAAFYLLNTLSFAISFYNPSVCNF